MYGIEKDEDFTFLCGAEVAQITITSGSYKLFFYDDIEIVIYGSFSAVVDGFEKNYDVYKNKRNVGIDILLSFMRQSVVAVLAISKDVLRINFEGGDVLKLYDTYPNYESFEVRGSGRIITI